MEPSSTSPLSRQQKELLYLARQEKARRSRAAPLLTYKPHSKQQAFHEAGRTKRIRLILGANKSGKTWGGANEGLAHSYGYRYWEVPGLQLDPQTGDLPPREDVDVKYWVRRGDGLPIAVPNTGMVVTGLARERGIGQVVWPVLEHLLPPSVRGHAAFKLVRGPQGVPTELHLPNGSRWIFASADQDPLTFEGTRIYWAWADEPIPPFIFNGIWRGLIVDVGPIWFTLTPLGARAAWMYNKWVKTPPADTFVVKVGQRENPALTEAAIREFEQSGEWSEAERRARLNGDFESLGNRAIHNFDAAVHVIPARALPKEWRQFQSVDPHHSRPPAVIWAKKDPLHRRLEIFREYPTGDFTKMKGMGRAPTQLAIDFRNIEGADPPHRRICDPRFGKNEAQVHGKHTTSWVDQMGAAGMNYDARVHGVGRIETGEQKIVDLLRYDRNYPIGPSNTPGILIHDCCHNLIASLENYGILPERDPTKGEPEKRSEEWKDFIDTLRYLVLYEDVIDDETLSGGFTLDDLERENHGDTWQ